MKAYFLVNASRELGLGHWLRCSEIAKSLLSRGYSCHFITETQNDVLLGRLSEVNIQFQQIDNQKALDPLFLKVTNKDIVLIDDDRSDLKELSVQERIMETGATLVYMTNDTTTYFQANFIVSYNILSSNLSYNVSPGTKLLTGLQYFIFREEFRKKDHRKQGKEKNQKPNILISLGGSDPGSFTDQVVKSLFTLKEKIGEVNVVLGNYADREIEVNPDFQNIQLHRDVRNMTDFLYKTDIAISGTGTTFYEISLFGIPSWIIAASEREMPAYQYLVSKSIAFGLGTYRDGILKDYFQDNFIRFTSNPSGFLENSNQLMALNPFGLDEVVNSILNSEN